MPSADERDCFEYAAQFLPEGYAIEVTIENGAASAELFDPDGEVIADERYDETMSEFIRTLTDFAGEHAEEQQEEKTGGAE